MPRVCSLALDCCHAHITPITLTLLPQAGDDALARSTAIHKRAVQLHDGVLGAFPSSGDTDIDLLNLYVPRQHPGLLF